MGSNEKFLNQGIIRFKDKQISYTKQGEQCLNI